MPASVVVTSEAVESSRSTSPACVPCSDRVTHATYGLGLVIGVEGDGDTAVLVDFGARQERITPPYGPMHKL